MSSNPHYNPENFGLSVLAEVEYSSGSYEFDTRIVWIDKEGKLYTARDEGCSCPTPFEDYTTLESLDTFDIDEIRNEIKTELGSSRSNITPIQVREFLRTVEEAFSKNNHA